ncbi:zinc protease [Chishuiella changwenlii]|uniref:Peptidase M16 n=1 Tax=Chishuiella changwenlii TaxID=1434701 RepID=A0A1M6T4H5_9FLAO|nr:pitrilysin family protein [Chishuiella changwenlii]GGE94838.1 peptidase M16 [Chishuiella changwenlii]SHK51814.1 zinc protease [Chishuiella changwenlii]
MKKILLSLPLLFVLTSTSYVAAQTQKQSATFVTQVEGIKEYKMGNGLQVLLVPDQSQSNVVVNIVYNVGSKHEGYGEKGMAHLLEHMLFKSTKNLGDIKKMLSDKGGDANGTTYYDRTNYYEIFPSNEENLRWSIQMEADRMINATIKQEDLDKEFSVVRNEFEIGENNPTSVLMERIISAGYLWHNYGKSTIGSKEDIERVKSPQLRKFYEKYYQPDNATLIVAGKFDEKKVIEFVNQYFGSIPRPTRVLDEIQTVEPAQDGEKFVEVKRAGDSQSVGAMYHVAPYGDKDYAAIDVLSKILTSDPSGYLYKALVDTHKVAAIFAYSPEVRDASFYYFGAEISKDKNIEQVKTDIRTELNKIGTINYTDEDVQRAKASIIKSIENDKNNTINYAVNLTEIVGSGDYRLGFLYRDNIEKVTKEDIKRVAQKYFKVNNRTIGVFIPTKDEVRVKPNEFTNKDITELVSNYKGRAVEKEAKPFEASIKNLKAHFAEGKLSNGLKYGIIDKEIKGEKVVLSFNLPVSNETDLASKGAIGELTAQLLMSGTKKLTKEQIKDQLDALKSSVGFRFSGQTLSVSINTYKNSLDKTMDIVRQIITEPTFPEAELAKTLNEYVTYLDANTNDPQALAFNEISRITSNYPKSSLFYTPSFAELKADLQKVKQADLVNFYKNILGAQNGVVSVVGTNDKAKVEKLLNDTFGKWTSKSTYKKAYQTFTATKKEDKLYNIPDKENATAVGQVSFKMNKESADYPAMVMMNEMLGSGGFLSARLPMRLREKEGISYGAGSYISIPTDVKTDVASWSYYAFLNPTKRDAVEKAVKEEISLAIKDGFTADELKTNIVSWKNGRTTSLGTDNTLLSLSNNYLLNGISFDDYDKLEKQIDALKVSDVNNVLKKYISLDKLTSVYTGTFNK